MSTHDIELPPLPQGEYRLSPDSRAPALYDEEAMESYALAAIEADRKQRSITKPSTNQDWLSLDPAVAFHLIERHAENWNDAGAMMQAYLDAHIEADRKRTAELLKKPVHVHSNMCRGIIAPITFDMLAHVLGEEATNEWLRKRRGEPVPKGWKLVPETPTSKQIVHMACQIKGADADGWFRTDGDDWHQHVAAAERAYKWALSEAPQPVEPCESSVSNKTACGSENGNCDSQPADPVKVPSDDVLDAALSNLEHDNYEQSYSGYKNRQADIALIRAILARYGSTTDEVTKQQKEIEESMRRGARLTDHRFKL